MGCLPTMCGDPVVCLPVADIGPANLALAWRRDNHREVLRTVVQTVALTT